MKLFTNVNNPQTLKILISCNYAKKDVDIELVNVNDKRFQSPKRVPVLELDSGRLLFSSNVSALFIFPPPKNAEKEISTWANWDSVEFQPLIYFIGTKTEPTDRILALLDKLNSALGSEGHLIKSLPSDQVTVADVCLWSTIYPLVQDDKLKKQFLSNTPHILSWYNKLKTRNEFQEAEKKFKMSPGAESLQSFSVSCWYPSVGEPGSSGEQQNGVSEEVKEAVPEVVTEEQVKKAVEAWEQGVYSRLKLEMPPPPVLPVKNNRNILITSALPYVNNVPHLGNIIGCVLSADVFARYSRYRSWNTFFVCGTDEYGTATETKALEEGLTPQQICDKYFTIHDAVYKWFNISFDQFGRTTTAEQKEVVQEIFKACHNNGYTTIAAVDQLLCQKCDRYLADRFVEGICPNCKYEDARGDQCDGCGHLINAVELINPRCKQCQNSPVIKQSKQLFLDLPKIEDKLAKWVEKSSEGWSHNARVITKAWLKEGLKPRCITRDLKWGVPVPLEGFEQKVFYVWFDAPIGYMSITKRYTDKWLNWWKPTKTEKVEFYQFMAKDNVPFHSIMFPATIMASKGDYALLNHLMATEYLNYENGKFSKSRGIGVFGNDAEETGIPSDIFRFYLLYIRPEAQDTNFSWADLAMKNNTELLNNLGNFIMRSLSFSEKFFDSSVPPVKLDSEEKLLLGNLSVELEGYITALNSGRFRDGIKYILNISRHGNQYMQFLKPWVLIKGSEEEKEKAATVIGLLCNVVCLISSLLQPFMPQTVQTIAQQLNIPVELFTITETFQPYLKAGHKIGKPTPLFSKIEQSTVDTLKARYAGKQKSESPPRVIKPLIDLAPGASDQDLSKATVALQEAIDKQAQLVRSMKEAGKSKEELKPMIDTLLDLKKQFASLQSLIEPKKSESLTQALTNVSDLEKEVANQGDLVRTMKSEGKSKEELKPMIDKLLELKKKLAELKGEPAEPTKKSSESKGSAKKKNKKK